MKKFLTAIILVTIMLTTMVLPASAAGGKLSATASLSDDKTSFTVNLVVNNNPGINSLQAELSYDAKALKLVSTKNGKIFESVFTQSQKKTDIPYNIIWMDATASDNIKTNGVLVSYTFQVLKGAPVGQTEIKFDITDATNVDLNTVKFDGCSFKVNVKNTSGDSTAQNTNPSDSQNTTQTTPPSNNTGSETVITDGFIFDVEKPWLDGDVSGEDAEDDLLEDNNKASDESELQEGTASEKAASTQKSHGNMWIIILTIAAVIILGVCITVVAVCYKGKNKK